MVAFECWGHGSVVVSPPTSRVETLVLDILGLVWWQSAEPCNQTAQITSRGNPDQKSCFSICHYDNFFVCNLAIDEVLTTIFCLDFMLSLHVQRKFQYSG